MVGDCPLRLFASKHCKHHEYPHGLASFYGAMVLESTVTGRKQPTHYRYFQVLFLDRGRLPQNDHCARCGFNLLWFLLNDKTKPLKILLCRWLVSGLLAIGLMLGWFWAHQQATDTAFYPFLGNGHLCIHFQTYILEGSGSVLEKINNIMTWVLAYPLNQICIALIAILWLNQSDSITEKRVTSFVLALPMIAGIVILAKTGVYNLGHFDNLLRYTAPFSQAVIIFVTIGTRDFCPIGRFGAVVWRNALVVLIIALPATGVLHQRYLVTERYFHTVRERL